MKKFAVLMIFAVLLFVDLSVKANGCSSSNGNGTYAAKVVSLNIVETVIATGKFKTLVAALKAADLVKALQAKGPFTVFAPTDAAFAKLPKGTVESLLRPENRAKLSTILLYHVVPGKLRLSRESVITLEGRPLMVKSSGAFMVNGAKVVTADVKVLNGLIHIIDQVLIPKKKKIMPKEAVRKLIQLAIDRGAPLFNEGQASACAAIYEITIESLIKTRTGMLTDKERAMLQKSLQRARKEKVNPKKQAWILRHALNVIYISLDK